MGKTSAKKEVARKSGNASTKKKAPAKKKEAPAKRTPSTTTTKRKELVKRKKRLGVSVREQSLLMYPPTRTTWICKCSLFNSGSMEKCWLCGLPKTTDLLWPTYEAACKKVGIEVGSLWKIINKNNNTAMVKIPKGRWQEYELPEGYVL